MEIIDNNFLSGTQLVAIDLLQDVSTQRSLSTAYRIFVGGLCQLRTGSLSEVFVNSCTQLRKTSRSKRPAVDLLLPVAFRSRNYQSVCVCVCVCVRERERGGELETWFSGDLIWPSAFRLASVTQ